MKTLSVILSALTAVHAFLACTALEDMPTGNAASGTAGMKMVNTSADAVPGKLLFLVKEGAIPESDDALTEALSAIGASSMEKVFPSAGDNGAEVLDRWYSVSFDASVAPERAAELLAGVEGISKVQFNTLLHKASDGISWPSGTTKTAASGRFNDPYLGLQWNYRNTGSLELAATAMPGADINVFDAWRVTGGDPGIIVAVVDEGIQYNHPDLQQNMWTNTAEIPGNGIDDDGNGYTDDYYGCNFAVPKSSAGNISWNKPGDTGHATHIAGTIAAVNNNSLGVCGVAGGTGSGDGIRIMSCQVFDGMSGGDVETCAKAIIYAADMGASVLSCSFGFASGVFTDDAQFRSGEESIEADAIDYFISKSNSSAVDGGIAVFAAGNDHSAMVTYPGAYKGCISVSSISCDNLPACYTNYGPGCDIAAPGGDRFTDGTAYPGTTAPCIYSTMPTEPIPLYSNGAPNGQYSATDYGYMDGSSMACPHVAGIAALGLSYAVQTGRHFTREEFISMLLSSADDIDSYLEGTKRTVVDWTYYTIGSLPLSPYRYNMGSGVADAWRFLMKIDGVPCVSVPVGEVSEIDLSPYLGGNAGWIRNVGVSMTDEDLESLGLESLPEISGGKLTIRPTKTGSARIRLSHLVGGDSEDSDGAPSGMPVNTSISVISRVNVSANGGWL